MYWMFPKCNPKLRDIVPWIKIKEYVPIKLGSKIVRKPM